MKITIALLLALTAVTAHARTGGGTSADPVSNRDSESFACAPTAQNGLGIASLSLELSTEDPDGSMELRYERGSAVKTLVDYEGDGDQYQITPSSSRAGDISVTLKKKGGAWIATVRSESVDTFSVLSCQER